MLLASLASGVLVVSNLTNLLAASQLSLHNTDFLRHLALPSLAASTVGWFAYRRVFAVRARPHAREGRADRRALVVGWARSPLFLVLLLGGEHFGLPAWGAALVTEVGLIAVTREVPWRHVPVGTAALAAGLAVLAAGVAGALPHVFTSLGAGGVRGYAAGIVSANVLNNLPAVLVGLTHVSVTSRVWPLLLGVNLGPRSSSPVRSRGCCGRRGPGGPGSRSTRRRYSRVGAAVGLPAIVAAGLVLRILG